MMEIPCGHVSGFMLNCEYDDVNAAPSGFVDGEILAVADEVEGDE